MKTYELGTLIIVALAGAQVLPDAGQDQHPGHDGKHQQHAQREVHGEGLSKSRHTEGPWFRWSGKRPPADNLSLLRVTNKQKGF